MDILRFIAWWWNKTTKHGKILFSLYLLVGSTFLLGITVGLDAVLVLFSTILGAAVLSFIYALYKFVQCKWLEYKVEKDREAQYIVDKLKGTR